MNAKPITDAPRQILIAEDSPTQSLLLQGTLEKHGFSVVAARNGRAALDALSGIRPTLIISDIQMPEMDGYELCRRVKADAVLKEIPVMLLTSLSAPEDIVRGLECGADNFVVKPYEEEFLMARIRTVIANDQLRSSDERDGIQVEFAGRRYVIDASRRQILNLLLSTYETALKTNDQLNETHEQLKAAQSHLIEAEKLQSVGRLAAGVAHEVKNPLAIMEMGIDYLATQENSEDSAAVVGELKQAVKRASAVIANLMVLSAPEELGMRAYSMAVLLDRAVNAMGASLTESGIEIITDYESDVPEACVDGSKIEQAFRNVLSNAIHATPRGGAITLRNYSRSLGAADVDFDVGDRSGSRFRKGERGVFVEVIDHGEGIAPENLTKIYDPFFSTKPTGKGMGLGLTVAKQFVDLHGGRIKVANREDGGVVVTMLFRAV